MSKYLILLLTLSCNLQLLSQQNIFDIARSGSLEQIKSSYAKLPSSIDRVNEQGYTPLILAVYNNNTDVAIFLSDKVSNINEESSYGTALMAASYKGYEDLVKHLLKSGANPNSQDGKGATAAHLAVMFRHVNVLKLLKSHNANFEIKNNQGQSAKDLAKFIDDNSINTILNLLP